LTRTVFSLFSSPHNPLIFQEFRFFAWGRNLAFGLLFPGPKEAAMKNFIPSLTGRAAALIVLVSLVWALCPAYDLSDDDCGRSICLRALENCAADALFAALLTGPQNFGLYITFCLTGYEWCLKYIEHILS
jgi:hypothetical protein